MTQTPNSALEQELLLGSVSVATGVKDGDQVRALLAGRVDWRYLSQIARRHKLSSLLYRGLKLCAPDLVPSDRLQFFRGEFQANAFRSLFLTGEQLRLLDLFERQGIVAVPFKGPILAMMAYGDVTLRQFDDLDILVPKHQILTAKELLISEGYRVWGPATETDEQSYLRVGCAYSFEHDEHKIHVDLHWRFTTGIFPFRYDIGSLLKRLTPVVVGGRSVLTFCSEDMVLLQSVHGAKHAWERLEWILALAQVVRGNPSLDWQKLLEQARRLGCRRVLLLGLALASKLFGSTVPPMFRERITADHTIGVLTTQVQSGLFSYEASSIQEANRDAFILRSRERLRDRVSYVFALASYRATPTLEDQGTVRLPGFLSFLYYFIRPFRLVRIYGLAPLIRFIRGLKSV